MVGRLVSCIKDLEGIEGGLDEAGLETGVPEEGVSGWVLGVVETEVVGGIFANDSIVYDDHKFFVVFWVDVEEEVVGHEPAEEGAVDGFGWVGGLLEFVGVDNEVVGVAEEVLEVAHYLCAVDGLGVVIFPGEEEDTDGLVSRDKSLAVRGCCSGGGRH